LWPNYNWRARAHPNNRGVIRGVHMIDWGKVSTPEWCFIAVILFGTASVWTVIQWGLVR